MIRILALATTLLLTSALLPAVTIDDLVKAHGVDRFDDVETIRFTFRVDRGENVTERHWTWHPQSGDVVVRFTDASGSEKEVAYNRYEMSEDSPEDVITADKRWINDTFWLIWPLHLSWSDDVTLSEPVPTPCPITTNDALKVTISYPPSGGGYTPGDAYDLYLDEETLRPMSWTFRRGGKEDGSSVTWEEYKTAGPLTLSTVHYNEDRSFKLSIPNLEVE